MRRRLWRVLADIRTLNEIFLKLHRLKGSLLNIIAKAM
jgi:hypothetical protein